MAKTDFTFVGQPHDPYSISGSDDAGHWGKTLADSIDGGKSKLAFWYNCDEGNIDTGLTYATGSNHQGDTTLSLHKMRDISGNSRTLDDQERHLFHANLALPVISGSEASITRNNAIHAGDNQRYMCGTSHKQANGSERKKPYMVSNLRRWTDQNSSRGTVATRGNTWITGSHTDSTGEMLPGGYTLFINARAPSQPSTPSQLPDGLQDNYEYHNHTAMTYPLASHSTNDNNTNGILSNVKSTFQIGCGGADSDGLTVWEMRWNTHTVLAQQNDTYLGTGYWTSNLGTGGHVHRLCSDQDYETSRFHPLCARYDGGTGAITEGSESFRAQMFVQGELIGNYSASSDSSRIPRAWNSSKNISLGSMHYAGDSWMSTGGWNSTNDMVDHKTGQGTHEAFAFDNALSGIRMQQMQRYMADRLGRGSEMSASSGAGAPEYLSQFHTGPEGATVGRTTLADPLSNANGGTYHRVYKQAATASATPLIQHETGGGAFVRSDVSSAAFYRVPSTKAISMRMWVRCDGIDDANHTGSHVALVAKATSPFGHQMDNIKGYALKYGTFKNGLDTGNVASFRLSLRNADQWEDGSTTRNDPADTYDTGDIDVANGTITSHIGATGEDKWVKMRLDVIPSGYAYDLVKAYASVDGTTWLQLGNTQTVYNDSKNYRYWCDDPSPKRTVRANNGIHNGYWIAMSSSDGKHLVNTKYYIEGFKILTDSV